MDEPVGVGLGVETEQIAAQGGRLRKLARPKGLVGRTGAPADEPHGNLGPRVEQAVGEDGSPVDIHGGQVARAEGRVEAVDPLAKEVGMPGRRFHEDFGKRDAEIVGQPPLRDKVRRHWERYRRLPSRLNRFVRRGLRPGASWLRRHCPIVSIPGQ